MDRQQKAVLMNELWQLAEKHEQLLYQIEHAEEGRLNAASDTESKAQATQLTYEIDGLLDRYLAGLPIRVISRCPFTGEIMQMAIDDLGLDGIWWNYHAPKRPEHVLPATFFALDGSMLLSNEIEIFPYVCGPGPDVPFVLPRLLEYVQVKAVISSIQIGAHTAYPIVYFAEPPLTGEMRVNDWATNRYWESGSVIAELTNPGEYVSLIADASQYDFDLEPWIKAGKLLWIDPKDTELTLHGHVSRCPYLNLPGSRQLKWIQNGKVWIEDDEFESMPSKDFTMNQHDLLELVKQIEEGEWV